MASIVWANVVDFAAPLSSVDPDAQTAILAHVNTVLDVSLFGGEDGPTTRLLRIFMAAHMATTTATEEAGAVAGPVASESAGGISRSYANLSTPSDDDLKTTSFGRAYLSLVRTSPARVGIAF